MLKRDIWKDLKDWKRRSHHPLVVKGLRQSGKTFIVRRFGEKYYSNCIYIDLRSDRSIHRVFDGDFNVDQMVLSITAAKTTARFEPGNTLLILDEIQDCPNARSSLKYWDLDGRFDVIATGSFLGVKGFRKPYMRGIPVGYEEQVIMYPLSFCEFLDNVGITTEVIHYVRDCLKNHQKVETTIHESMRALYLQYLIVGGMPEAVNAFLESHDVNIVREIQRRVLNSIRDDFGRCRDKDGNDKINEVLKLRATACLDSMSAQLSKEYKKFKYSLVNVKGHSPEKADGLQYLVDVGLIIRAYNTRELSYPLEGVKITSEFKAFYIDTGLLISQLDDDIAAKILSGDISAYKGAIAENMVASAFIVGGFQPYYYHAPSGSPELDFLFEKKGEVVIVECKSTNNRATSMKYVLANPKKYGRHRAIKFADTNVGMGSGYETYPLYAIGFLERIEEPQMIPKVEVENLKVPQES